MPVPAPTSSSNGEGRTEVRREFTDALGRPQHGWAKLRSDTWGDVTVSIQDGVFLARLLPGSYSVQAALYDPDNQLTRKAFLLEVSL